MSFRDRSLVAGPECNEEKHLSSCRACILPARRPFCHCETCGFFTGRSNLLHRYKACISIPTHLHHYVSPLNQASTRLFTPPPVTLSNLWEREGVVWRPSCPHDDLSVIARPVVFLQVEAIFLIVIKPVYPSQRTFIIMYHH